MNRLCIFAHWDRDNIIDDYVVYYLNALKDVCNQIIFVSDCDLEQNEIDKINNIVDYCIAEKHGEYDFGSYKRGYFFALDKELIFDELILVNDSVYGPFYPLKPIFEKMQKQRCDFWGMTANRYGIADVDTLLCIKLVVQSHIQSYFLVFRKTVLNSNIFYDFMKSIKKENSKNEIIKKYEIGLSQILYKSNFKSATYIKKYKFVNNSTIFKWDKLIKNDKYPFIKTSLVKNGSEFFGELKGWDKLIREKSDYPIEMIEKNSQRLLNLYKNRYQKLNIYRKIRFHILKNAFPEVKLIVILIEKVLYKVLNTICFNKLKKF